MAPAPDPALVEETKRRRLDVLMARFVACREAGDAVGKKAAWDGILMHEHDRVLTRCRTWRGGELTEDEARDAAQRVFFEALRMMETLEATMAGQVVTALRTAVGFRCLDVFDERLQARRRDVPLGGYDDGDDEASAWQLRVDRQAREAYDAAAADDDAAQDAAARVTAMLERLDGRRLELVLLMLEGQDDEEIAARLRTSVNNVHQLRSRIRRQLDDRKEQDA